jgi:E3 ubiquitin-protein ligase listerin
MQLHRYPALCVHSSRRIRHLAASLHSLLMDISDVRASVFTFLREVGPEVQVSQILGSWCLSAWDIDRGVAARGTKSWNNAVVIRQSDPSDHDSEHDEASRFVLDDFTLTQYILPFTITTVMDPASTFSALNPSTSAVLGDSATSSHIGTPRRGGPAVSGAPPGSIIHRALSGEEPSSVTSRVEDDPESVEDRNARLRVAAMGALTWFFGALFL